MYSSLIYAFICLLYNEETVKKIDERYYIRFKLIIYIIYIYINYPGTYIMFSNIRMHACMMHGRQFGLGSQKSSIVNTKTIT